MFGYPVKAKSAKGVIASVIDFNPPWEIKLMHSDPAPELRAATGSLEIAFEPAPVGVKGANGIVGEPHLAESFSSRLGFRALFATLT